MLIASLTAAILAAASPAAASPSYSAPPTVVTVEAAADVSHSLITMLTQEADAVWRPAGVSLVWQEGRTRGTLHVVIGHERGNAHDRMLPLGWIRFDDNEPLRDIYVSYENAFDLLTQSFGAHSGLERMPRLERETLLGRAMGRALAHELGHYLAASKVHTTAGLMQATHTAYEFFAIERVRFGISPAERDQIVARLRDDRRVAASWQ